MDLIKVAEQAFAAENPVEHPSFNTGDTVSVHYKIVEGNKERCSYPGQRNRKH